MVGQGGEAGDVEDGGQRLDARQFARPAVVDWIGRDQVGQEARVGRLHLFVSQSMKNAS